MKQPAISTGPLSPRSTGKARSLLPSIHPRTNASFASIRWACTSSTPVGQGSYKEKIMKLIFLVSVGSLLLAQSVPVIRNPPPVAPPNMQDFAAAAQALEQAQPAVPGVGKSAAPMPIDFKPR